MPKSTATGSDCRQTRSLNSKRAVLSRRRLRENLAETLDRAQHLLLRQPRPLAAHDEVIDTQKLAIPRDLLFHRPLVADDEPVAGEILERALRGAVLQSP